jgi:hypothetical protein
VNVGQTLFDALGGLTEGRLFAGVAESGTAQPYITYQRVGGDAVNFLDRTKPSQRNYRFQFNVWADSWLEATTLAEQIEDILRLHPSLQTTVEGSAFDVYEDDTKLYGTSQDFSFWLDA